jgi:hypothetical protein
MPGAYRKKSMHAQVFKLSKKRGIAAAHDVNHFLEQNESEGST